MNRVLLYINDLLESLDIPPITRAEQKKSNSKIKNKSKTIRIEEK